MFLMQGYKKAKVIEAILLTTECCTENEAERYLKEMFNDGMTLDDAYTYFTYNTHSEME